MTFLLIVIGLMILFVPSVEQLNKECEGHIWNYESDGIMRCKVCRKKPLEL